MLPPRLSATTRCLRPYWQFLVLVLTGWLAAPLPGTATHIVGGHLGMEARSNNQYFLRMTLYFDALNGNPTALDSTVQLVLRRRGAPTILDTATLPLLSSDSIIYPTIPCQGSFVATKRLEYGLLVTLNPQRYADPRGYYIAWERCCRNGSITNIIRPGAAGSVFYLAFPALVRNGAAFRNSSPQGFQPTPGYACLGETFRAAFGGSDPDGDSLAYDLTTPLNGFSTNLNVRPVAAPAPYPSVDWAPGFDSTRQISGAQPLRVDARTGEITFTSDQLGLFVFGVRCSEYRRGVKIGEVRREFQQLVVQCPRSIPVQLRLRTPGAAPYVPGSVIALPTAAGPGRCLGVAITSADSIQPIRLSIQPLNAAAGSWTTALSPPAGRVRGQRDTLRATVCLPNSCNGRDGRPAAFRLIIRKDGCLIPDADSLDFLVAAPALPDRPPGLQIGLPAGLPTVQIGDSIAFPITGFDPDPDTQVRVEAPDLLSSAQVGLGIRCPTISGLNRAQTRLTWRPTCAAAAGDYQIRLRVTSFGCPPEQRRDTLLTVRVVARPDAAPRLLLTPTGAIPPVTAGDSLALTLTSIDLDAEAQVRVEAPDLQLPPLAGLGIGCRPASGLNRAQTRLTWRTTCATPPGVYSVRVRVASTNCPPEQRRDTVLTLRVAPRVLAQEAPYNIFTPNGDGRNDTFAPAAGLEPACGQIFRRLRIFNRWGREVFASPDRLAAWAGGDAASGIYYYVLEYSDRSYKGWVELVR